VFDYSPDYHKDPPEIAGTKQFLTMIKNTKIDDKKLKDIEKNIKPKEDFALFQYTGGTTGLPKGAMLTHFNLVANVTQLSAWNSALMNRGKDTALTNLPLVHIYGITACMNLPIQMAATIGLNPDPRDEKSLFEIIRDIHPSMFPGVPTMYMRLLERDDIEDYAKDLKSIKICNTGAMAMPPEILKEFEDRTGALIIEGYGMTETSCASHVNPANKDKRKIGSIGIPLPSTEAIIVDIEDHTKILPIETEGEIMLRGPQMMQGYWNKPEATADMIKEGRWMKTGDIAKMDKDGYFFIVDRKKDMINVSGYKVFPREVEDLLYEHEAIEKVSVIGIPDEKISGSERVKAFVVLKEKYRESEELSSEIREFCRKSLAPYKVPKFIEFRKELPETFVGKVLRKDLKEQEARERGDLEE
jgi:long-chain acyl-CoA synthetase